MAGTSSAPWYSQCGRITKLLACLVLLGPLQGCATSDVPPIAAQGKPVPGAANEPALGRRAEQQPDKLTATGKIDDDLSLAEYLRVVRGNAALEIRAGRFGLARRQLDRVLALAPQDPVAHLYYGDLYRLEAQRAEDVEDAGRLLAQAREAYEQAAMLDPAYPDPFRQLGLLYYQCKDNEKAVEAFRKYLALRPDAPDARRIGEYVAELDRR